MPVHFFVLLRRTKDKPDCIKSFDTQIMVFAIIFAIKIVLKNNVYLESFIVQQN